MKLDFTVLWIDDQPRHISSYQEKFENSLEVLGFELEVISANSLESFLEKAAIADVHDRIDLVLIDYDLGQGAGGELVLAAARRSFPYKEIIFYSSTDVETLRSLAYEARIDGVHFADRFSLVDEATEIVKKLLARVLDVDHMRGLVMSAASDIDDLVSRSLRAVYKALPEQDKLTFLQTLEEQLRRKLGRWESELNKAATKGGIDPILDMHFLYGASDRLNSLAAKLQVQFPPSSEMGAMLKTYGEDVVPKRNKLAHVRITRGEGIPEGFTEGEMSDLRCRFIEHRRNFYDIAVLLDVPLD